MEVTPQTDTTNTVVQTQSTPLGGVDYPASTTVTTNGMPILDIFMLLVVLGAILTIIGLAFNYYWKYFAMWYRAKDREKYSAKTVLLEITIPRDNESKIDAAEQFLGSLNALKKNPGRLKLKPQHRISFEIVAMHESIKFYILVHQSLKDLIEKQLNGAYPDASIKEVEEYNIFSEDGHTAYKQLTLKSADYFPIKTYKELAVDPLSALTSALGKLQAGEGAVVQLVVSPNADGKWKDAGKKFVKKEKDPGKPDGPPKPPPDAKQLEAVEGKIAKPGYNVAIRIVVSSTDKDSAKSHLDNINASFEQFTGPYNNFSGAKVKSEVGFMTDFIHRYMPTYSKTPVLTTDEIASIFHLPSKAVQTPHIVWLPAKRAPAPDKIPTSGLFLGRSIFRGIERPVYINEFDRQRHMYIIGRTGTGKTTLLKSLILQDILAGKGIAFIDPHGDAAEELLELIPPNRAEDVIYFDPSDTSRPLGMNMLEAHDELQKHFVVTEIIGMMYKLFDPNKTGIIGPRFEHGVRNAMLTAMGVPGATFIEVMRVMTDSNFVREILPSVTDPVVRRYWTDQIAQTSDFHKSEVLDYTTSKFGRFVTNRMIRNMIGQSRSSLNFRDIMDNGKILIVNLSKGKVGDENSNFLGLILVPKILAAAMSRVDTPEDQRRPFYLYVDEFQNFATDTFATILSEARKYRLNLIVANQFIGQIQEDIKNAIIGNVGTIIAYRMGVTDANFLAHEFQPTFNENDLVNIEARNVYIKTQVNGEPVHPFSMSVEVDQEAWKAMRRPEIGKAIVELSRLTYGRDVEQVEAEISQRSGL
jgi:hypothetical protein